MGLFGKDNKKTPREQVREWNSKLRKQSMLLDRQIRSIQREEEKVKQSLKQAAKSNDRDVCAILAKELVNSRKAIARINTSKAQINSVMLNMNQQLATLRVSGSLQKSAEVMKCMNSLVKLGELSDTMRELSREMMRAGIIEEMLEETIDNTFEEPEEEEEVQKEVDKILSEITQGQLGKAPAVVSDTLPSVKESKGAAAIEDDEEELSEMQKRLEALKS
ncbi:charged multivesicular body protein 3-like protein [Dinothrombium tinctorium]|uniref:Charged multivesicular body protein 3-like protein n=1 Tax=Dinothrombium tinctorium TaxID=1965070 RepID=A0A3S3P7T1_9ACAR|nr:charged multivesicular body protein 3-like protein [Dinothrombium tinctorium]